MCRLALILDVFRLMVSQGKKKTEARAHIDGPKWGRSTGWLSVSSLQEVGREQVFGETCGRMTNNI